MARPVARQRVKGKPGAARWLLMGGGAILVLVLTFALGIAVGRKWSPHAEHQTAAEPPRKPAAPAARRSGLTDPSPERPPQEKLTFYQTLTAPMSAAPLPAVSPPAKVSVPGKPESAAPHPPTERVSGDQPAPSTPASPSKPDKPAAPPERPSAPRPGEARTGDWVVQVGVFKDRGQAESVRRPLAASGFDAYLTAVPVADGQMHYKVRMGSFKTREEAARMAERIRQERSLTAFITPK
jgi:cell division protein FtsN